MMVQDLGQVLLLNQIYSSCSRNWELWPLSISFQYINHINFPVTHLGEENEYTSSLTSTFYQQQIPQKTQMYNYLSNIDSVEHIIEEQNGLPHLIVTQIHES